MENTSDSFMPRPLLFCLKSGRSVCYSVPDNNMPTVTYEIPYENAKEMLLVEEVDNKDFLTGLFDVMYDELPTPKPKKKK